jgi:hypothetical protein
LGKAELLQHHASKKSLQQAAAEGNARKTTGITAVSLDDQQTESAQA